MKLNRTALRTIDMLKLVSKRPDGITLDEICTALDLPKTSAYDIATTLVYAGLLHMTKEQKQRYHIGLNAYRIGISYTNHLDFIGVIDPELKAFAREVGKTVFFGVRSDEELVYLCKSEPENPIITTATVGTKNPLYCTSLGKAILAFEEKEVQDSVIAQITFVQKTPYTIVSKNQLKAELEKIREKGYALDARELEEHMECVGAPVFGQDGSVVGAISVSSLYKPTEDYDALGKLVKKKAAEVSRLLGFLGKYS